MSFDQPQAPQDWMQPPKKPGMSTAAKVILILAIVFGVLALLCCGGAILIGVYVKTNMISNDPQAITKLTDEITQIEIPSALKPEMSFNMKLPFVDQSVMVWVVYADKDTHSALVLAAVGKAMNAQNQEQIRQSLEQSLQQQGRGQQENLKVEQTSQKELEIRGEKATFTIAKGQGTKSNKPRIQVTGAFQGKSGPAMLLLNVDAEKVNEEQVAKMLESIK